MAGLALCLFAALSGCVARSARQATAWGVVPMAGPYGMAPPAGDPAIAAQVEHCLGDMGLKQAAKPRYLVELADTVAPARVGADGMTHDEPLPVVTTGQLPRGRADRETLTLVITDVANGKEQFRARLIERKPKAGAHGQPAIGDALCTFVRTAQSTPH